MKMLFQFLKKLLHNNNNNNKTQFIRKTINDIYNIKVEYSSLFLKNVNKIRRSHH